VTAANATADAADLSPAECARALLAALRSGDDPGPYRRQLATLDETTLDAMATDREAALSFWLNCYNAGTQLLLDERSDLYDSSLRFVRFFGADALTVAGTGLSLDDIEHGIVRGSKWSYGMGYLPRPFPSEFERRHRLPGPDPRVHFALNCGAESCPAIRSFDPDGVDAQLDRATRAYLDAEVEHDRDAGRVALPRVFLWYRGDFGSRRGIRTFLRAYDAIPDDANPALEYRSWDWSKAPGKFAD